MRVRERVFHGFIHQWLYSPLLGPGLFFSFVIFFTQTVGLLVRVIRLPQGRYLHTGEHKHRISAHTNIHAFEWDSNPRSQPFHRSIVHALDRAITVIGWRRRLHEAVINEQNKMKRGEPSNEMPFWNRKISKVVSFLVTIMSLKLI
jgi:hypothetical protein